MEKALDTVLGRNTTEYKQKYAPDYLVRFPRSENRLNYGIEEHALPFVGFDIWHGYEASFLSNGFPVNGLLKLAIPCTSKYIVESKSLKLYLFSYMMEELGSKKEEAVDNYVSKVRKDLSELLECAVKAGFHKAGEIKHINIESFLEDNVILLEDKVDTDSLTSGFVYVETPELLETRGRPVLHKKGFVRTLALKSNCKITHQADFGELFIYYESESSINLEGLYRYIVSFRNENHFHEEIVECLFKRLQDTYKPKALDVMAFYTRRGGIDICPMRSTRDDGKFAEFESVGFANYRAERS